MPNSFTFLGDTDWRNQQRPFGMKHADRHRHLWILGKTGTGKSTLLRNLIIQDIRSGAGVAVIDPHGDLCESILSYIPSHRTWQTVYFNAADVDFPVGFNILEAVGDARGRHLVTETTISVFKNLWADSWGPRSEHILRHAVMTLLEIEGSTLLWIPRLLADQSLRASLIPRVHDPVVKNFWLQEYDRYDPHFRKEAIAPLQNKLGAFLASLPVRNIVGQTKSTFDLGFMMDERRILLCNLAKGMVGEQTSHLLGSLLMTKLYLAALARQHQLEHERKDFFVHIDEAHTIAGDVFSQILSEIRKYRVGLSLAHQYVNQLDPQVKQSMLGNVGTLIVFRIGAPDAKELALEFAPEFSSSDLESLDPYQIYIKLAVDGLTTRPFSARTHPPIRPGTTDQNRESIIKASREKYGRPRHFVEEKIHRWLDVAEQPPKNT